MSRYSRFSYEPPSHPHRHNWYSMPQKAHFTTRKKRYYTLGDCGPSANGLGNRFGKHLMQDEMKYRVSLTDNAVFLTTTLLSFCLTLEASRSSHTHSQVWLDMTPMDSQQHNHLKAQIPRATMWSWLWSFERSTDTIKNEIEHRYVWGKMGYSIFMTDSFAVVIQLQIGSLVQTSRSKDFVPLTSFLCIHGYDSMPTPQSSID